MQIEENGVKYQVDIRDGQKTGFFLDQKYNRLAIQKLCKNARVLDCFTHTGSFALNAGIAGASEVTGVDASQLAVDQATANAALNGLQDRVKFICQDVFELLPSLEEQEEKYDVVILDPPAFTKSRNSVKNAVKGYREINLRAMKLVKDGGFLATCSCSHFMTYELFTKTIGQAARSAHKRLRQMLPESQLDRFMAGIKMGYPSLEDETAILMGHGKNCSLEMVNPVITAQELLELQRETAEVYIHPSVCRYLVELSNATRNHQGISLGLSTRGTLAVSSLAKAAAYMDGRDYVLPADGAAVFEDAAVHRLRLSAKAETEGGDPGALVRGILESVPMPRPEKTV